MILTLFVCSVACNTLENSSTAIVVPYRDRPFHLAVFHRHIRHYWKTEFECNSLWLLVVEQDDDEPFNRAALANVGILEATKRAQKLNLNINCIVFHDVDLVPLPGVPYTSCANPVQLGSELQHFGWSVPYAQSAGGIVSMSPKHWFRINGFSNKFKGWGGEDDDLYNRLRINRMLTSEEQISRPPAGHGRFRTINEGKVHHPRIRSHKDYQNNVKLLKRWNKNYREWKNDGLNSLLYCINSMKEIKDGMHIWVDFKPN